MFSSYASVVALVMSFSALASAAGASTACLECMASCGNVNAALPIEDCVMACKDKHQCPVTFVRFDTEKQRIEKIIHHGGVCGETVESQK